MPGGEASTIRQADTSASTILTARGLPRGPKRGGAFRGQTATHNADPTPEVSQRRQTFREQVHRTNAGFDGPGILSQTEDFSFREQAASRTQV